MAGIYLHIPFCRQKCHYCNFFSLATTRHKDAFTDALLSEALLRSDYLEGEKVETIYFGGGTPSLLSADKISHIITRLSAIFNVDPDAEITLEANPDDLSEAYLEALAATRVNRLSIGVQSFRDEDLKYLNRVHSSAEALNALHLASKLGFGNLTIDLIYGIPTLDADHWRRNLDIFFSLGIKHLSAYALTVEPRTALDHLINVRKLTPVDELETARQFEILIELMEEAGFIHYEISNFALPDHYSRHNSLYWLGGHYLGLGPSAHSFNGRSRQWNVSRLDQYMKGSATENIVLEKEVLTWVQRYNEYVMTSLRTSWGTDLDHITAVFGKHMAEYCLLAATKFIDEGKIRQSGRRLFLTMKGKLFADGVAASLFADE
ncbi:MAG TPA: radical SAM family heme chaperone HemW [Bacteroidales bacterium]|nr:radical SAM family heme chaperone HemW [Bacteroidales bacterium]